MERIPIEEDIVPEFDSKQEPTEQIKREILKIHRNLGHPPNADLARALRSAKVHPHIIRWAVKEMRCPVCESRTEPRARRHGALPRCMTFNETVGVDCFEFKDCGYKKYLLNCLCWGTGFQMACIITDEQLSLIHISEPTRPY